MACGPRVRLSWTSPRSSRARSTCPSSAPGSSSRPAATCKHAPASPAGRPFRTRQAELGPVESRPDITRTTARRPCSCASFAAPMRLDWGCSPARDGPRIRPLLRARRSDVDSHVRRHRIPHCNDPSNQNPRFLRVRVRLELLPVLERLNPRVVEHMYVLADELGLASVDRALLEENPRKQTETKDRRIRRPVRSDESGEEGDE